MPVVYHPTQPSLDSSDRKRGAEGAPPNFTGHPVQAARTSYEGASAATASGEAASAAASGTSAGSAAPSWNLPGSGAMQAGGKRVSRKPAKYKQSPPESTPSTGRRRRVSSKSAKRSVPSMDAVLAAYPTLRGSLGPDAGRLLVTTYTPPGTPAAAGVDAAVGRPVAQATMQSAAVPPLVAADLDLMDDPAVWPMVRVGDVFKLQYASRRQTIAPASLSSKWHTMERPATRPYVAVCGNFGVPYGGKGATPEDDTAIEVETYCWSLGAMSLGCFRCGQPVDQDGRAEPFSLTKGLAHRGLSCWCKTPNDLLVTAPSRSLAAGHASVARSATANPDGSLPVTMYVKIPRQSDEQGWLDGLADTADAKDAPVAMFIRVRESHQGADGVPQCSLFEGFVRVVPSAFMSMAPPASTWGATGGPATGSLLATPSPSGGKRRATPTQKSRGSARPSSAPAEPRPRSSSKGKRRDSTSNPVVSTGAVLRICFNCNFFLPLRDFTVLGDAAAICTGCRDREESIASPTAAAKPSRYKKAASTKAKGRTPLETTKRKGRARAQLDDAVEDASVAEEDDDDDDDDEVEEKTLHYWGAEETKADDAGAAAGPAEWNDEDMDE